MKYVVLFRGINAARASSSRVNKIITSPIYPGITIRNWNTTTKLAALLDE